MLGPQARVVDSAHATALETHAFLESRKLRKGPGNGRGSLELRVTDLPKNFAEVASRFLGEPCDHVEQIDL